METTDMDNETTLSSEKSNNEHLHAEVSKKTNTKLEESGAPDGGWGWVVVFGSSLCHFYLLGIARTLGIVFILLRDKFGASAAETALVSAMFVCIRSGGGPIASLLSNKFGCRKVGAVGGLLLFVGIALSAFSTSLLLVYLTFGVIAGLGAMLVYTPCYIIVNYWFDKHRGIAMSLSTIGTGLGTIVLAYLMAYMSSEYQYLGSMLVVGALMLHTTAGSLLFLNPPAKLTAVKIISDSVDQENNNTYTSSYQENIAKSSEDYPDKECHEILNNNNDMKESTTSTNTKESNSHKLIKSPAQRVWHVMKSCVTCSLWRNFPFIVHCFMMIGQQSSIQALIIFLPSYARDELNCSPIQEAWILAAFGLADLIGRLVSGFVFDVKAVRPHRVLAYKFVSILFAVFTTAMAFTSTYTAVMVLTVLTALFEGGAHSQRATIIPCYVSQNQVSIATGFLFLFMGIGNFFGPVAGGKLRDSTGSFSSSFLLMGVLYLVICITNFVLGLVLWLKHKRSNTTSE